MGCDKILFIKEIMEDATLKG